MPSRDGRAFNLAPCSLLLASKRNLASLLQELRRLGQGDPLDLERIVAVSHCHSVVLQSVFVDGEAKRRADLIHATVTSSDRSGLIVPDIEAFPSQCFC